MTGAQPGCAQDGRRQLERWLCQTEKDPKRNIKGCVFRPADARDLLRGSCDLEDGPGQCRAWTGGSMPETTAGAGQEA